MTEEMAKGIFIGVVVLIVFAGGAIALGEAFWRIIFRAADRRAQRKFDKENS
jgi:hypothetical protein